ncbi:PDR/VanB family oxidoreductase [Saccharopolyspora dendranthemae]|uniref:Ferredoxin-NADP reductase n=1 Tax=Saccharopolyspora dendranthemae TaxID=1181886 RepID=A0A561U8I6_9PSEU|nr:PDR/VanB family oxidoreductase [Saccharopolyspora dendranthemae]TWF95686.1 ferredoxin-NADP reductase [Saccharopolyspora dendranthemae]
MQKAIIDDISPIADGVAALTLRGTTGPLAPWEPGAHIDVTLPNWLTRQYSLCGEPGSAGYRIAVRRERLSRGGSEYVHDHLRPGKVLDISAPRNTFPLLPAPEYLFVAGGIGITPVLPMLRAAAASGATTTLAFAGRSTPFADELRRAHGERVRFGRPDLPALAAALDPAALVYCCGPEPMLAEAEEVFPADRLHVERFRPRARTFEPDTAFEAVCARSGRTVPVEADESLLDALRFAGLPVAPGCREGVCGSCELRYLDGRPEHRDEIGAAEGRIYPCVSRSLSPRLTLDL